MFEREGFWVKDQVCIAMALLEETQQEWLLIGSSSAIRKAICGKRSNDLLYERIRPMGAFLNDFNDEAMDLVEAMFALNNGFEWKKGGGKRKLEIKTQTGLSGDEHEKFAQRMFESIWQGDNPTKKFVALRIWKEYSCLLDTTKRGKFVDIRSNEFYDYCARYIYPFCMGEKWVADIDEPLKDNSPMYRLTRHKPEYDMQVVVVYPSDKNQYEYACVDYSLLGLKAYYRQKLMLNRWIVTECKVCNKIFLAKTFRRECCSKECEKKNAKSNRNIKRSNPENLLITQAYNRENNYWKHKLLKVREESVFSELEYMYREFKNQEKQERQAVRRGERTAKELSDWYQAQRRTLDTFLDKNEIK